jgi:hypothetical protein
MQVRRDVSGATKAVALLGHPMNRVAGLDGYLTL